MKYKRFISLFLVLFFVFSGSFFLFGDKLNEIEMMAYRVKPTVVLIETQFNSTISYTKDFSRVSEDVKFGSGGSGFFVNPEGYLVTNGHVVEQYYEYMNDRNELEDTIIVYFIIRKLLEEKKPLTNSNYNMWKEAYKPSVKSLNAYTRVSLSNGEQYPYEIKKYSPKISDKGKDIAVLKIERENCPVLMLGNSSKIALQNLVFPVGYPALTDPNTLKILNVKSRLQPTITRGTITSLKQDYKNMSVIQTDAAVSNGNSGGPAVNVEGEVIGIATFVAANPLSGTQLQGYSFLIPVNTAKEFIRDTGIEFNVESEFTKVYNQLLDSVWNEKWFEARNYVAVALSYMKDQPDLEELQQLIYTKIENLGWFKKLWLKNKLVVIISGVLFLLIVLILVIALRPSSSPEPEIYKEESVPPPSKDSEKTSLEPDKGISTRTVLEEETSGIISVIVKGEETENFPIKATGVTVGRDPAECDIVIPDSIVSRRHLKIIPKGEKFYVTDLESRNGTYVGGKKIKETYVGYDESVQIGKKGTIKLIFREKK